MPKNGDINTAFGLYRSRCWDREIVIHKNLSTLWKFVQAEIVPLKVKKKESTAV